MRLTLLTSIPENLIVEQLMFSLTVENSSHIIIFTCQTRCYGKNHYDFNMKTVKVQFLRAEFMNINIWEYVQFYKYRNLSILHAQIGNARQIFTLFYKVASSQLSCIFFLCHELLHLYVKRVSIVLNLKCDGDQAMQFVKDNWNRKYGQIAFQPFDDCSFKKPDSNSVITRWSSVHLSSAVKRLEISCFCFLFSIKLCLIQNVRYSKEVIHDSLSGGTSCFSW